VSDNGRPVDGAGVAINSFWRGPSGTPKVERALIRPATDSALAQGGDHDKAQRDGQKLSPEF
jgi:hypothetical protein